MKVGGVWLFRGTSVPISALFANLEGGATVDEFVEWFPGVSREQVNRVLEHAAKSAARTRMRILLGASSVLALTAKTRKQVAVTVSMRRFST